MKKYRVIISVLLALIITMTSLSAGVSAAEDYSKKTVSSIWADATRALLERVDCETKISVDKNGKEQKTYIYDIKKCEPVITIAFSDGVNTSGSIDMIEKTTGIKLEFSPLEFTDENHSGYHDITVTFKGVSTKMSVHIAKFELTRFSSSGAVVTENADGEFVDTSKGKVFKYNFKDKIQCTAEFDNSVTVVGTAQELEEKLGYPIVINYEPEKDTLKLGDNIFKVSFMGKECEIKVYVRENPVNKISATAKVELVENVDGYWDTYTDGTGKEIVYFHYDVFASEPYFELKLKEDKQRVGDRAEIENVMAYKMTEVDNQSSKPWTVGKNKATILFMGHECTFDVTVVESNVKTVSISGENELTVKVSYKDGKQIVHKAQDFVVETYNENEFYGSLITDNGIIENVVFSFEGDKAYATIEGVKSNTLDNNWLPAVITADILLYYSVAYSITDNSFAGLDSHNSSVYLDSIVGFALYLCAEPVLDEEFGVYYYHTADLETTEKYIKEIFGISGLDLTKAKGYNAETGLITVPREAAVQIVYQVLNTEFKDGRWVFLMAFAATDFDYTDQVEIVLNEDFTLDSIMFISKAGDVNGDGKITAIDARVILQYVAGLIKEDKLHTAYADVNGDGSITAVDARLILQYVAGLI